MEKIKKYFKEETQWEMLGLEHSKPAEFYLSVWQTNRSPWLLLLLRGSLCISSLGIVLASMILYGLAGILQYWFIYLTHWGMLSLVLSTGFATAVSARSVFVGPINTAFNLPWYVQTYWVLYNIANPLAYLITIFYWTVLYEAGVSEELNPGLDVAVHALNTVIMLVMLCSNSHPSRLLHVYQPMCFGLVYVAFGLIYYFAGGTDTEGNRWVYSVINWARPGTTIGVLLVTGLLLILLHLLTVGLALARDALAKTCIRRSIIVHVEEGVSLQPSNQN